MVRELPKLARCFSIPIFSDSMIFCYKYNTACKLIIDLIITFLQRCVPDVLEIKTEWYYLLRWYWTLSSNGIANKSSLSSLLVSVSVRAYNVRRTNEIQIQTAFFIAFSWKCFVNGWFTVTEPNAAMYREQLKVYCTLETCPRTKVSIFIVKLSAELYPWFTKSGRSRIVGFPFFATRWLITH